MSGGWFPEAKDRPGFHLGGLIAVLCVPTLVRLIYYPAYAGSDDAFIHASIIEMLRRHGTWGLNPGHNVNMSTSPLFTLFFWGMSFLPFNLIATGMVLSSVAVLVGLLVTYIVAIRLSDDRFIALVVAGLAATNVHLWRWGGTFMEVSFAYMAVSLCVLVFVLVSESESNLFDDVFLGVLLGVSAFLRPEVVLILPAFFLHDLLARRRRITLRYGLIALGLSPILLSYAVLAEMLFGSLLPSTFSAKTSAGVVLVNAAVAQQLLGVIASGTGGTILAFACFVGFCLNGRHTGALRELLSRSAFAWAFPLLGFAFYYLKVPSLQSPARYFLPFLATIPLVLTGITKLGQRSARLVCMFALVLQLLAAVYLCHVRVAPVLVRMWDEYVATMTEAAREVRSRCGPHDVTLVEVDIGVVSWRLGGECILADGGGLASPELQHLSLDQQIQRSGATLVLETLGAPGRVIGSADTKLTPLWERVFASHSVAQPNRVFAARLYRVDRAQ